MLRKYLEGSLICIILFFTVKGQEEEASESRWWPRRTCKDNGFCKKEFCKFGPIYVKYCPKLCGKCDDDWVDPARCIKMGCDQGCRKVGEEIKCICHKGYKLSYDEHSCEDINECLNNPCPSGKICNNKMGDYVCSDKIICYSPTEKYFEKEECCKLTENTCGQNRLNGLRHDSVTRDLDSNLLDFPWTAMVVVNGKACTGAILSDEWVVAPAHCFDTDDDDEINDVKVEVGSRVTDQRDWFKGGTQSFYVDDYIIHPDYDFPHNDIALVHLDQPAVLSGWVYPACMPQNESPKQGDTCWLNGYESHLIGSKLQLKLAHINMTMAGTDNCKNRMSGYFDNDFNLLCGEFTRTPDRSACPGETGGVMVCQRKESCDWYVSGVASFGDTCSQSRSSSHIAFTPIHEYEGWIFMNTEIVMTDTDKNKSDVSSSPPSWSDWTNWSKCSQSCGGGQQKRSRKCRRHTQQCPGEDTETRSCNTRQCQNWGKWTPWSSCSRSCKGGWRKRERQCQGVGRCPGQKYQYIRCNGQRCPEWSNYGPWSPCSKTCGGGLKKKIRRCMFGEVGQPGCIGAQSFTERCNAQACESWTSWGGWSSCSKPCGPGAYRKRNRSCKNGRVGDKGCRGSWFVQEKCDKACPVNWLTWGPWQQCSRTCGNGEQISVRKCPQEGACEGDEIRKKKCNLAPCRELLADWAGWSSCSVTCAEGVRQRKRSCSGIICPRSGETWERQACTLGPCKGGEWSAWSNWSECAASCGQESLVARKRECPRGFTCEGHSVDMKQCRGPPCSVNNCDDLKNEESLNYCINRIPDCVSKPDGRTRELCQQTCCYSDRITKQGKCEDHPQWLMCDKLVAFCNKFPNVRLNCKKTCGNC